MVDRDLVIHPGEILMEEFLRPHGLTPSGFASRLDLPANRFTAIVNGERGISSETAVLLAAAFGTTEAFWLNLQSQYDLEQARASVSPERVRKARDLHNEFEAA
ncbi:addiction module antidote protein, HigA family (plasmid) [Roseomonas gilardii]|jgi:addiction module HigA family antidote|uniref:Addiction module antidote protein, HigA family n=1 Tax=Roseomonas gilardii TaxID=257708 RepID=A0A1L7ANM6_9PROT|nr:HigA family addiction module antitoxin [Roseomonas gilardii]APT60387.1 addiction module antidote protein, HigA family [Roseomonas gilardii]